ncbi:hypothetical protein BJ6T_81730 [Bradyrhizobium japonicum USDA 6]|nr:hypothetical protein BJ6T_81730 [Bradyrhizobium japonicum USDA 6]
MIFQVRCELLRESECTWIFLAAGCCDVPLASPTADFDGNGDAQSHGASGFVRG